MPSSLSRLRTLCCGGSRTPSDTATPSTSSPFSGIPPSFSISVYKDASFTVIPGGGPIFEDKPPVAQGTAKTKGSGLFNVEREVIYNWEETSQQADGSYEKAKMSRWSNNDGSVLWKQTNDQLSRFICIFNTCNSKVPGTKIAGRVAISDWFGPKNSTPTGHSTASTNATAINGMASMWNALPDGEAGAPQGNLPLHTEGADRWELLQDLGSQVPPSQRLISKQGGIESEQPDSHCMNPGDGGYSVMGQGGGNSVAYTILGAGGL